MISVALAGQRRRVETCKKSLCRSLFVACGAVDLAGEKQSAQTFRLQRRLQFARIDVIVFDRVARPHELRILQTGNRRNECVLNFFRQRRRNSVRINGVIVEAFRFEKNLMAVALAEFDDLIFDRRTITRARAGDLSRVHRRAMHVGADDVVRRRDRARDGALDLRFSMRVVRIENGSGGSSPGCISNADQSMLRPSSRGGVPVFNRPSVKPIDFQACAKGPWPGLRRRGRREFVFRRCE